MTTRAIRVLITDDHPVIRTGLRGMLVGEPDIALAGEASGALLRERSSRPIRWARANPWRFALAPGVAAAAIVFALSVVLGGGIVGPVLAGLWHGAVAFGLTGAV